MDTSQDLDAYTPFQRWISIGLFFTLVIYFWRESLRTALDELDSQAAAIIKAQETLPDNEQTRANAPYKLTKAAFGLFNSMLLSAIVLLLIMFLFLIVSAFFKFGLQYPSENSDTWQFLFKQHQVTYLDPGSQVFRAYYLDHVLLEYGMYLLVSVIVVALLIQFYVSLLIPNADFYDPTKLASHIYIIYYSSLILCALVFGWLCIRGDPMVESIKKLLKKGN